MNTLKRGLYCMTLMTYIVYPAVTYSAPGTLSTQPLWLDSSVKHNVILAIDDSGSMDSEVLFAANDGAIYIDTDNGLFTDASGNLNNSGEKYVYLFPNGHSSSYNGSTISGTSNHFAIPPVKAYAFARYAGINKSYYDPDESYAAWPSYGGFTFEQADISATLFEPAETFSSGSINLFTNINTSVNGINWGFDIQDDQMACDDTGAAACSPGENHFTYYPATYYVKDTTSSYTYTPSINSSNSVLLESEDGVLGSPMKTNLELKDLVSTGDETDALVDATLSASNNSFVGSLESLGNASSAPATEGGLALTFTQPATGSSKVWFRVYARDGGTNSFWVTMSGKSSSDITLGNDSDETWSGDWNRFTNNFTDITDAWHWVEWGEMDLAAGSHTLEVKRREGGTYVDQILVTSDTTFIPSDIIDLDASTRACATDASAGHYPNFAKYPGRYKYVNSTSIDGVDVSGDEVQGIATDGSCLIKYEITGSDSDTFSNGSAVTRTVLEEKQNFANWFTYYRRRHQAMRGGLASAFQSIGGIQTGIFWINDKSDVTMYDMDDNGASGEVNDFLTEHYGHVQSGGTPLRSALKYAGDQFKRTDASAPIASECQKNFTLLFTDGYNSETSYSDVGNEDDGAGGPYEDSYSGTLGDIAYKYYSENLNPSLAAGKVNISEECSVTPLDSSLDCNANLHMNTYTVGLGAEGTIFGNTHDNVADAYTTAPVWPNVNSTRDASQIDDLYHAAVNGRGEMYSAQKPSELGSQLSAALQDIVDQIGSGSGVTFNSSSIETDSLIFTTLFNSSNWSGDLAAKSLDSSGAVSSSSVWSAADKLDARDISSNDRTILTYTGSTGVAFEWSKLPSALQNDLKTGADGVLEADDVNAQLRLRHLRGEGMPDVNDNVAADFSAFRLRGSRLGDVVHSTPIYIGVPASGWPDADPFGVGEDSVTGVVRNRFSDFKNRTLANGGAEDREPVVYVGANDGMLHGFNAKSSGSGAGEEVLAYVPYSLASTSVGEGLHYLTDPDYIHRYYVDLAPVVQDVYIDTTSPVASSSRDWASILVGGLRGGGRGLFALDVTNPANFSQTDADAAKTVLWEFTSADDSDVGYMSSPPIIAMMENEKWAVIFGNGYNSDGGLAKLFIVYIEEGLDGTWSSSDYVEIDTEVGSVANKNGLSGVAVADTDGNSLADRVYAGDLQGNMWAFDLSNSSDGQWKSAYKSGSTPKPLFVASDGSSNIQPITAAPNLAYNSEAISDRNVLVTFGTGQYLATGDDSDTSTQSYYTVWDKGGGLLDRDDLIERVLERDGTKRSITTGATIDWAGDLGWFFDLGILAGSAFEKPGERLTHKPLLIPDKDLGPVAVFASMIPDSSECAGGASSVLYAIPLLTGENPTKAIMELDGDADIDDDDRGIGVEIDNFINEPNHLAGNIYGSEGDGGGVSVKETTLEGGSAREGRLGWHELIDQ